MKDAGQSWVPDDISLDKPNPARIYDYYLGGHHNFAADREVAERTKQAFPDIRIGAVAHRAFLRRVIRFLATQGLDQYLDIGSGLPTAGNVHELARAVNPDAQVVYVDVDPVVIAHSGAMLRDVPYATIIQADLREPSTILEHEEVRRLLDLDRPLSLTMTAVFHYVTDDQVAYRSARVLTDALAPGSYVVISHTALEEGREELLGRGAEAYRAAANVRPRTWPEIARFFDGLELVEPGLVRGPLWRPEGPDDLLLDQPERYMGVVGVARKP
ncbi:MAG: SAM-dependent methyltransferase [Chloroflexota bacterium]|nr:SAM-dependent methyltransferase [Chloroflexota bacterium]